MGLTCASTCYNIPSYESARADIYVTKLAFSVGFVRGFRALRSMTWPYNKNVGEPIPIAEENYLRVVGTVPNVSWKGFWKAVPPLIKSNTLISISYQNIRASSSHSRATVYHVSNSTRWFAIYENSSRTRNCDTSMYRKPTIVDVPYIPNTMSWHSVDENILTPCKIIPWRETPMTRTYII